MSGGSGGGEDDNILDSLDDATRITALESEITVRQSLVAALKDRILRQNDELVELDKTADELTAKIKADRDAAAAIDEQKGSVDEDTLRLFQELDAARKTLLELKASLAKVEAETAVVQGQKDTNDSSLLYFHATCCLCHHFYVCAC